jgi:hypothetical protein
VQVEHDQVRALQTRGSLDQERDRPALAGTAVPEDRQVPLEEPVPIGHGLSAILISVTAENQALLR